MRCLVLKTPQKGGRSLCAVYMCACVNVYTHSHCTRVTESEKRQWKARESQIERERGYRMCTEWGVCAFVYHINRV